MYPVTMRYGIGYGNINFYESTDMREMDGEAFEYSIKAIYDTREYDLRTRMVSEVDSMHKKANDIFKQIDEIKKDWGEDEYRLYWKYKSLNNIEDVADVEKKKLKELEKNFDKMKGKEVLTLENNVINVLKG